MFVDEHAVEHIAIVPASLYRDRDAGTLSRTCSVRFSVSPVGSTTSCSRSPLSAFLTVFTASPVTSAISQEDAGPLSRASFTRSVALRVDSSASSEASSSIASRSTASSEKESCTPKGSARGPKLCFFCLRRTVSVPSPRSVASAWITLRARLVLNTLPKRPCSDSSVRLAACSGGLLSGWRCLRP